MYGNIPYYILLVLLLFVDIFNISSAIIDYQISAFEYGHHTQGEEASFAMNGNIPHLMTDYSVNVLPPRPDLDKKFTYLIVEYHSPMSAVEITYYPDIAQLAFYIRFPFRTIPFGIVGYSLKVQDVDKIQIKE